MYRKTFMVVLAFVMVFGLTAMGLAADEWITADRIGNPEAQIVLDWWVQADFTHRDYREARANAYREVFTQWAEENPDVQIRLTVMPGDDEFKNRLMLAASRGNAPDMSSVDSFWAPWFVERGYLQSLNDLMGQEFINDLFPFVVNGVSDQDGNIRALWHSTDVRALYYRTDIVSTPPRTWDELFELSEKIQEEYGIYPYIYNGGRWEGVTFDNFPMFWGQGGDLVDESGAPVFNLGANRAYMLNLMTFLRKTIETGTSPSMVATFTNYQDFEPLIAAGDVAMFQGGSWQAADLKNILSPEEYEKWDVAPVLQQSADMACAATGGWTWGIFTDDPVRKQAAYDFFATLMSPENMAKITKAAGNLPTRMSVFEQEPYYAEDRFYSKYGLMLDYGRPRPGVPIYPTISEELQIAFNAMLTSGVSAEKLLDDAWENVLLEYNR